MGQKSEKIAILTEYQHVTDGRTDGRTDSQ